MPLLSVNTLFVFLNSCPTKQRTICRYYTNATFTPWDNADSMPQPVGSTGVRAKAFYLELMLEDTSYICRKLRHLLPSNASYAFTPPTYNKTTPIDSFTIKSDADFDAQHPAGSDLKALFSQNDTANIEKRYKKKIKFYLLRLPASSGTHTFTVKLFARDTTQNVIAATQPIKLLL